jgi:malate synthase
MDIRIEITGPTGPRYDDILTPEALEFLTKLHDLFLGRRQERLSGRMLFRQAIDNGRNLRFLDDENEIRRNRSWRVAGPGPGLEDRRVEITGPTDRKMTVNALNSGAKVWLADFEDATSPTWSNIVEGQINLFDAIRRQVDFTSPEGKEYKLGAETPTIVARPRGWHLVEKHLRYTDQAGTRVPASASLVDFGLYFFHNAAELIARGTGPYFYLPKLENHLEARLWNDVFTFAEANLGIPHGTIRATVLIETITAAFEMEEILYELRDHAAGLNAGRWDYVFSIIKNFRGRGAGFVLPDRTKITMTTPFMRAYTELLVATCHQRGAHAIGGMSAFIPNRRDPVATEAALEKVAADKRREATDGFDGSWVAHPDLVPVALAEFDVVLGSRPNQVDRLREDVQVAAADLVDLTIDGEVTDAGVRANVSIALRYLEAWLRGTGAVALDGLMEDAATAEISRSQLWQWAAQRVITAEGTLVTREWIERILIEELDRWGGEEGNRFEDAAAIFRDVTLEDDFPPFLTIPAYTRYLVDAPVVREPAVAR